MSRLSENKKDSKKIKARIIDRINDPDLMVISRSYIVNIICDLELPPDKMLLKLFDIFQFKNENRLRKKQIH